MSYRCWLAIVSTLVLGAGCHLGDPVDERPFPRSDTHSDDTRRADGGSPRDADVSETGDAPVRDVRDVDTSDADNGVDARCRAQSDRTLCEEATVECGSVTVEDDCSRQRTVDCDRFDGFGCSGGSGCTKRVCQQGVCESVDRCAGTDSECGCTTCTDCNAKDGWYDDGAAYSCSVCKNSQATCSTCQDQDYHNYSCQNGQCEFQVEKERTVLSDCTSCPGGNNCDCSCRKGTCQTSNGRKCKC